MLTSLRSRLLLSYALVIVAVLLVVGVAMAVFLLRTPWLYRRLYTQQEIALRFVQRRLAVNPSRTPEDAQRDLGRMAEAVEARLVVLAPQGRVLADTAADNPLAVRPPRGDKLVRGQTRDTAGNLWVYTARRLPDGRWLIIAQQQPGRLAFFFRLWEEWLWPLVEAGLLAVALALVLAWGLSRWVARPLHRAAEAAHALAEGIYQPVPEEGPAEAQTLARAFNDMAQRLEASQRSQREFVANVSHELKTPLTSIQGFAQAILDGTAADPKSVRSAAEVIVSEAGRMHRLVVALLDLARLDAGTADLRREPVDVTTLLETAATRFRPLAEQAEVALEIETTPGITLTGDGDRLMQVLSNLLDNAIRHTPPGGRVRLGARLAGHHVEIRVADTGEGIPPEAQPRIFERFYRGDKSRSGGASAGLGLAIARQIVRAHGGDIRVHSTAGKGSVFVVQLPRI